MGTQGVTASTLQSISGAASATTALASGTVEVASETTALASGMLASGAGASGGAWTTSGAGESSCPALAIEGAFEGASGVALASGQAYGGRQGEARDMTISSESERGNFGGFLRRGLSPGTPAFFKAAFHPSSQARSRIPGS
ncbi:hypothetical protein AAC387_Pa10g1391 [Persea americana]